MAMGTEAAPVLEHANHGHDELYGALEPEPDARSGPRGSGAAGAPAPRLASSSAVVSCSVVGTDDHRRRVLAYAIGVAEDQDAQC